MRALVVIGGWLIGLGQILMAQVPQFDLLRVTDGLASDVPTAMLRDSRDFVWIGTQSGLQRYDGYELRTYAPSPTDSHSLRSGAIKAMVEDGQGDLWIGTANGGLSRYRRQADRFDNFVPDRQGAGYFPYWGINDLYRDRQGRIWVCTPNGLLYFWPEEQPIFQQVGSEEADSLKLYEGAVEAWTQDSSGAVWASVSKKGLCRLAPEQLGLPPEEAHWQRFPFGRAGSPLIGGDVLLTAANGELWVGSSQGVICLTDQPAGAQTWPESNGDFPFTYLRTYPASLFAEGLQNGTRIYDAAQHPDGSLWLMGAYGLYRWFPESDSMAAYSLAEMGIDSRGLNLLMSMYIDPQGLLWLATFEGLARPADRDPAFETMTTPIGERATMVRAVLEDQQQQRWVGVENGGLWVFDEKGKPYRQIRLEGDQPGLNYDFVMALLEDERGHIWVATFGGGYFELMPQRDQQGRVLDVQARNYLPDSDPQRPGSHYVYSLLEDQQQRLWIGAFEALIRHDRSKGRSISYPCPVANCLLQSQSGRLLAGTDQGLFWLDEEQQRMRPYAVAGDTSFLHNYRIECLAEGPDGLLWMGTRQGLLALNRSTDSLRWFGTESGLTHLHIRGLLIDQHKQLWVASLTGLHRWTGEGFTAYRRQQGILNDAFIDRAHFASRSGRLYFGGAQGVVSFDPKELERPALIPQLRFTGMQVFGQKVAVGDTTGDGFSLSASLAEHPSVRLSHRERMVSFSFAALGYRQVELYRYAYRLEGFDQAWREQDAAQRVATYTNLPPGDYTLRVRAWDAFGQAAQQEATLQVQVDPPWWLSGWAYAIYALMMIGFVVWLVRLRSRALRRELAVQLRIEQAKAEEREAVRARSARDFHDEAGSYLTKLSLYTGLLRQQQTPEMAPTLTKLEENIRGLSAGMRDFIWVLDSRRDSLTETMLRLRSFGEQLFEAAGTDFRYQARVPEADQIRLPMTVRRHLLLIVKEALNNALKYARAQEVTMKFSQRADDLVLEILDDGIGFDADQLGRINGLTNMQNRAEEMGAYLAVNSTPGLGTRLRLSWPISPNG